MEENTPLLNGQYSVRLSIIYFYIFYIIEQPEAPANNQRAPPSYDSVMKGNHIIYLYMDSEMHDIWRYSGFSNVSSDCP